MQDEDSIESPPPNSVPGEVSATIHLRVGETIAHGGMGAILEASDAALDRTVAMKVLLPELEATDGARQRFVREAMVLARLEHPNIVPIHDLGRDDQDRPFYTMKLVKGRTLQSIVSEIADGSQETLAEFPLNRLLTIFGQVCDAIAFAHNRGVIHRDLKPANIMIGEFGETLVMDWGLAKFLSDEEEREATCQLSVSAGGGNSRIFDDLLVSDAPDDLTVEGAVLGSPKYMSPEQAQGRMVDVDQRSDIYALGGLLYAILTLQAPIVGESVAEILANVKSGNITPPTQFEPITQAEKVRVPETFARFPHCPGGRIPDALSAVVMRALEREPADRYQQVTDLAKDIAAFQGGFATSVESVGLFRLAALYYRRNRVLVVAAFMVLLAVIAGLGFSTAMLLRERAARQQADLQTAKSREVAQFLKDTLAAVGPSVAMGRDTAMMRAILDQTAARMDELSDRPEIVAELKRVIGNAYNELRVFEPALANLKEALRLRRDLHPEDHPELAGTILDYAAALEMAGREKESEPFAREALAMWRRLEGPDCIPAASAESLIGWLMIKLGRPKEGVEIGKHALKIWRLHPGHKSLTEAPNTLATLYEHTGRNPEAVKIYAEELAMLRKLHGPDHPLIANNLDNYGTQLMRMGQHKEAEKLFLQSLPIGRKFFGDRSPDEDHVLSGLARIAGARGDLEAQINYARQAIAVGGRVYPVGHRYWRDCHGQYLRTVLSQVEKYLQRARKNRARAGDQKADLKQAKALLSELEEVPNLGVLTKSERPWINYLSSAVDHMVSPTDASIRNSLTEALEKVRAAESRSGVWKKRARFANEFHTVPTVGN